MSSVQVFCNRIGFKAWVLFRFMLAACLLSSRDSLCAYFLQCLRDKSWVNALAFLFGNWQIIVVSRY